MTVQLYLRQCKKCDGEGKEGREWKGSSTTANKGFRIKGIQKILLAYELYMLLLKEKIKEVIKLFHLRYQFHCLHGF